MNQIPPLPALEISKSTKRYLDQETVDRVLAIVYERRPDLFARFAERERENLGVEDFANEFYHFVRDEVRKVVDLPQPNLQAGPLLGEARRRARLMYGLPFQPY